MRAVVLSAAVSLAACSFDAGGLPTAPLATPVDAAGLDASAAVDAAPPGPDAAVDAAPAVACPAGYTRVAAAGRSAYRAAGAGRWRAAEADCENDGPGAHLAVIDDTTEALVARILAGGEDVWVGVSDRVDDGVYRTVLGELATFLPWAAGEPNDLGQEDCVELDGLDRTYNDSNCQLAKPYICECDGRAADRSAF